MYDYIKGILTNKTSGSKGCFVTLETNSGVGFLIETTSRDFSSFKESDEQIKIYTILLHREDKMSLCGFIRREDRDIFNILTSVSGVGSKMALTLLDNFEASQLIGLVINGDFKSLTTAKGVGTKLAQKIILELKDKLINYNESEPIVIETVKSSQAIEDAQSVLLSLGYEKNEIKSAMSKSSSHLNENASAEDVLRETLKMLSIN